MAHYAEINKDNIVTRVLVAEESFINTLSGTWIKTSYNTSRGQHLLGGEPLRFNFAGVGYTYDSVLDAFIPPKPFDSWILNEEECAWYAPVEYPNDGKDYSWDEEQNNWVILPERI